MKSCSPDGSPICTYGKHVIGDDDYFYIVNPDGGYGRDEVLICETCLKKPENDGVRERLKECGVIS
jgi:hypothetical protein